MNSLFFDMRLFITVLIFSIVLSSCNKLEDGPFFSIYSKTKRIKRSWKIESVLNLQNNEYHYKDYDGWTLTFEGASKYSKRILYGGKSETENGVWKFEGDVLYMIYYPNNYTIEKQYNLLRLTQKELWIKDDVEEIHYVVY